MPLLDVTDILHDPDFMDLITVRRRADSVDAYGRSSLTSTDTENVGAVITMATGDDLRRFDVGQVQGRAILVITEFRLHSAKEGNQPDQVLWDGGIYTVYDLQQYNRYGAGFVEAIAISMEASDPSPSE